MNTPEWEIASTHRRRRQRCCPARAGTSTSCSATSASPKGGSRQSSPRAAPSRTPRGVHAAHDPLELDRLDSKLEAQMSTDDWREDYNAYRPYQSLRWGSSRGRVCSLPEKEERGSSLTNSQIDDRGRSLAHGGVLNRVGRG
jgi:hypothetical protein